MDTAFEESVHLLDCDELDTTWASDSEGMCLSLSLSLSLSQQYFIYKNDFTGFSLVSGKQTVLLISKMHFFLK